MSLRQKVVLILLLVTAVSVTVNYITQQKVLLPSFTELERVEARKDMDRCVGLLQREMDHLDQICFDWAAWDDTYAFVQGRDPDYVRSNLGLSTFTDNRINLLYILNTKGRVVWGRAYDLEAAKQIDIQEFPHTAWALTHPLLQLKRPTRVISGVFLTTTGPMLVASCPIIHSNNQGPIRGAMVMARWLDDNMVREIGAQANVQFRLWPMRPGYVPEHVHERITKFSEGQDYHFESTSSHFLAVHTTFPDVTGRPALLLRVDAPRNITAQGKAAVRFTARATIVVALGVVVILLVFLRSAVIMPLQRLTRHVSTVNKTSELALLTDIWSQDELGRLTREFNNMVRRVQGDAAQRREAERALQQSEGRIRAILTTAPDGVITVRDDGAVESFNPAAARMFGYTPEEIIGCRVDMLLEPASEKTATSLRRFLAPSKGDSISGHKFVGKRKDGTTFPLHVTRSAPGDAPDDSPLTLIARDITELNRMYEKLRETEHLAAIGELGASVAHEIRNPLAGISGAAQILNNPKIASETRDRAVHEILSEVTRMERTVHDFLLFSRPWQPEKKTCDVRDLAEQICRSASEQDQFGGISFAFDGEPTLNAAVDAALIHQVILNLIQNAAQAMTGAGEIRFTFEVRPRAAVVTIRDNGAGMDAARQAEAFRPFFTTKTKGTGLGLPICKSIVEAHGGAIAIRSVAGEGTEVVLTFPRED